MPLCHPEIYADNLLGRLGSPGGIHVSFLPWFAQHLLQLLGSWQAFSLLPSAVAIAGQIEMEVMFTGHVYNLQSDRGLISQRSMTKGGFQRLSSLSNFLWPNEMAETCLESFWLETLLRVNKECDIHKSKWEVSWLPTWWFMPASFPLPLAVCAGDGQLETRSDWNQKSWVDLIPSRWIHFFFFCQLNWVLIQFNCSSAQPKIIKWLLYLPIQKKETLQNNYSMW